MAKTIDEINEKIKKGQAVVVTAEEILDVAAGKGIQKTARELTWLPPGLSVRCVPPAPTLTSGIPARESSLAEAESILAMCRPTPVLPL